MAGTTPIYGFPYPESSDLVADYPALGQDLAEDVEAAIAAVPPGGLVHIATESFSAVSSVSLNNVFTSAYDNYKIILTGNSDSNRDPLIRLRVGGSDNSTASSYVRQRLLVNASTISGARVTSDAAVLGTLDTGLLNILSIEITQPFLATATALVNLNTRSASGALFEANSITHNQTVSYDGFTLFLSAGNITGTIRVYGYANS
jgi:hypothetical protein